MSENAPTGFDALLSQTATAEPTPVEDQALPTMDDGIKALAANVTPPEQEKPVTPTPTTGVFGDLGAVNELSKNLPEVKLANLKIRAAEKMERLGAKSQVSSYDRSRDPLGIEAHNIIVQAEKRAGVPPGTFDLNQAFEQELNYEDDAVATAQGDLKNKTSIAGKNEAVETYFENKLTPEQNANRKLREQRNARHVKITNLS
jgi:hypothetical protein